jgi:hypothetical protein
MVDRRLQERKTQKRASSARGRASSTVTRSKTRAVLPETIPEEPAAVEPPQPRPRPRPVRRTADTEADPTDQDKSEGSIAQGTVNEAIHGLLGDNASNGRREISPSTATEGIQISEGRKRKRRQDVADIESADAEGEEEDSSGDDSDEEEGVTFTLFFLSTHLVADTILIPFAYPVDGAIDTLTVESTITWNDLRCELAEKMYISAAKLNLGYKFTTDTRNSAPNRLSSTVHYIEMMDAAKEGLDAFNKAKAKGKIMKVKAFKVEIIDLDGGKGKEKQKAAATKNSKKSKKVCYLSYLSSRAS